MHEYPVTVNWQGGRDGAGTVGLDASGVSNPIGVPAEFQGTGQGTNPEEMLTGAIASCYSMTFGIIAAMRKLSFSGIETKATGFVEQNGANFVYTKVVIRPTIRLNSDAGDDQVTLAEDMAHKADLYCIITNAVRGKVEVVVEPNIVR
jgi:peroxiredoxin-like protein